MTPDALTIHAAIRLSPADSIGVPVFMAGNSMYLPEMDADFNISAFMDFENEDGYELTNDVPDDYRAQSFRIGDPAPIIFWVKKQPYIIEGDAERVKLEEMFGVQAKVHPVLKDLGEMLNDARTGVFKAQQEEWLAAEIAASYGDVFLEPPSRTKYWISRYRAALENARKLAKPPHPIDVRLRRASSEWLKRFATKAELPMVGAMLGEAAQGIYSVRQITEMMFAYTSHRLPGASSAEIIKLAADATIKTMFKNGLYYFYLLEGWPHVPFSYTKVDFISLMKEALVKGKERRSWNSAKVLSQLIFGDREAPVEVDDVAMMFIRDMIEQYKFALSDAEAFRYNLHPMQGEMDVHQLALNVVACFNRVSDLSCVMHGDDRVRGRMMSGRFQVSEDDVKEYQKYLEGD